MASTTRKVVLCLTKEQDMKKYPVLN